MFACGQHTIQKIALAGHGQGWFEYTLANFGKAQRKAPLAEIARLAANLVKPTSETNVFKPMLRKSAPRTPLVRKCFAGP